MMASVTTLTFSYRGKDASGKSVKGRVEAGNYAAALARLRSQSITPIRVEEVATKGLNAEINIPGMKKRSGLKDLAIMSRQMSTMVAAGLSLLRTLNILAEQTENPELRETLEAVRNDVEIGVSLSDAFGKHPVVFPPLMTNLVRAGETGGFLDESLLSVAENFEKEVALRNKVKAAMTYPVMVLILTIVAVIGMLIFVVPVFESMFNNLGSELPLPTQFLVWLSGAMVFVGPALLILGIGFSIWWRKNKNAPRVRRVVDDWKLKMPIFGSLFKKIALARFSRNFATMIRAGVPLLQSLTIVGQTSGNYMVEEATMRVQDAVRVGRSLAAPLAEQKVFPEMLVQMVAVGEDAGSIDTMLTKVAEFYEQEVDTTTDSLTSLIEPLMIAFLAVVVGGMIVALYLPVFSVFEAIQ